VAGLLYQLIAFGGVPWPSTSIWAGLRAGQKPRSCRDVKAVPIDAAMFLKETRSATEVSVRDMPAQCCHSHWLGKDSAFVKG